MGPLLAWIILAWCSPLFESSNPLPPVVGLLCVAAGLCYLPPARMRVSQQRARQVAWIAALTAAAVALTQMPGLPGLSNVHPWAGMAVTAAYLVLLLASLGLMPPLRDRIGQRGTLGLLLAAGLAATVAAGLVIVAIPNPGIDVFNFLNEGARGFLNGQDPYAMQFTPLPTSASVGYQDPAYHFDVYGYLPGTLLLSLPTVALGDVRWLMAASVPVSAFFLRRVMVMRSVDASVADSLAVAFLAYPGLPWVITHAWVEPLIICAFLAAVWAVLDGRWLLGMLFTAVCLSIKQYNPLLLLPLWSAGLVGRRLLGAVLAAVAVCLPFALWSPADFWWDAIYYHIQVPPRIDAFSINGVLLGHSGLTAPGWLSAAVPAAAAGYALWRGLRGADLPTMFRLTAGAYFLLFLFNKAAFADYYFMLQALLLVAAGTSFALGHAAHTVRVMPEHHEGAASLATSERPQTMSV